MDTIVFQPDCSPLFSLGYPADFTTPSGILGEYDNSEMTSTNTNPNNYHSTTPIPTQPIVPCWLSGSDQRLVLSTITKRGQLPMPLGKTLTTECRSKLPPASPGWDFISDHTQSQFHPIVFFTRIIASNLVAIKEDMDRNGNSSGDDDNDHFQLNLKDFYSQAVREHYLRGYSMTQKQKDVELLDVLLDAVTFGPVEVVGNDNHTTNNNNQDHNQNGGEPNSKSPPPSTTTNSNNNNNHNKQHSFSVSHPNPTQQDQDEKFERIIKLLQRRRLLTRHNDFDLKVPATVLKTDPFAIYAQHFNHPHSIQPPTSNDNNDNNNNNNSPPPTPTQNQFDNLFFPDVIVLRSLEQEVLDSFLTRLGYRIHAKHFNRWTNPNEESFYVYVQGDIAQWIGA